MVYDFGFIGVRLVVIQEVEDQLVRKSDCSASEYVRDQDVLLGTKQPTRPRPVPRSLQELPDGEGLEGSEDEP